MSLALLMLFAAPLATTWVMTELATCYALAKLYSYQKETAHCQRFYFFSALHQLLQIVFFPITDKEANYRALAKTTDTYRPLVSTPRGQVLAASTTARTLVKQLRTAFAPIATRMDSPGEEEFAAMVAEYKKARRIVAAGHGLSQAPATGPAS